MTKIIQRIKHELMKRGVGTAISLEVKDYSEAGVSILCDCLLTHENIEATYIKLNDSIKIFCRY